MKDQITMTPSQLVEARAKAFDCNDFGFIYDTYHPESNFRLQFPDRNEYLAYGKTTFNSDYRIEVCRVLHEKMTTECARVLFYLKVHYQGNCEEYIELSEFRPVDHCWRYLSSHKMSCSEFSGSIDEITMAQVEQGGICF